MRYMNTQYGNCPACSALNMLHRSKCYRCRKPLPEPFGENFCLQTTSNSVFSNGAHNRRNGKRLQVDIKGVSITGDRFERFSASVGDISIGGTRLHTVQPRIAGSNVRLHIPLEDKIHTVEGRVKHCRPFDLNGQTYYSIGVEFTHIPPLLRSLLTIMKGRQAASSEISVQTL